MGDSRESTTEATRFTGLVFRHGERRFAVPATTVREVTRRLGFETELATPPVVGLVRHRGQLIPVVDLQALEHLDSRPADVPGDRLVVFDDGHRKFGLLVDAVDGIADVRSETAEQVTDLPRPAWISTFGDADGSTVGILDVAALASFLVRPQAQDRGAR